MGAAIWAFLNSPLGVTLLVSVIGKLFATGVKSDTRRNTILGYADTAFQVVESVGPTLGLSGKEKYLRFIEDIVDKLKAAGQPELSSTEMELLKKLATEKAILAKPKPLPLPIPRAVALPLPPPPRGEKP